MSPTLDDDLLWYGAEVRFTSSDEDATLDPEEALAAIIRLIEQRLPVSQFSFTMLSSSTNTRVELRVGFAKEHAGSLALLKSALVKAEGDAGFKCEASDNLTFEMSDWLAARIDLDNPRLPTNEPIGLPLPLARVVPLLSQEAHLAQIPVGYRAVFRARAEEKELSKLLVPALAAVQTRFSGQAALIEDLRRTIILAHGDGWLCDEAICLRNDADDTHALLVEHALVRQTSELYPYLKAEALCISWSPPGNDERLNSKVDNLQQRLGILRAREYCTEALGTVLKFANTSTQTRASKKPPQPQTRSHGSLYPAPPEPSPNSRFAFVSYAHLDSNSVLPIIEGLKHCGLHLWYDASLEPGNVWDETLEKRIRECAVFLACVSNNYEASRVCRREIKFADLLQKPILPLAHQPHFWGWGLKLMFQELQIFQMNDMLDIERLAPMVELTMQQAH